MCENSKTIIFLSILEINIAVKKVQKPIFTSAFVLFYFYAFIYVVILLSCEPVYSKVVAYSVIFGKNSVCIGRRMSSSVYFCGTLIVS